MNDVVNTSGLAGDVAGIDGRSLLPLVAVLGGAWAFFEPAAEAGGWLPLAAATALVLGGWMPFWHTLTRTVWIAPLRRWRRWTRVTPLPPWPYLQPGTPGAALHRALGQAHAWWKAVGRPALAAPLRTALLSLGVSVLIAVVLGRAALALTLFLVAWAEIAALWHDGRGEAGAGWDAVGQVGLPWLLGATLNRAALYASPAAETGPPLTPALSSLVLVALVGGFGRPSLLSALGPVLATAFLVGQGHPLAAGGLMLLALPGLVLAVQQPAPDVYRRAMTPWLAAMLILMAGVL
jgi:hypothetical protein